MSGSFPAARVFPPASLARDPLKCMLLHACSRAHTHRLTTRCRIDGRTWRMSVVARAARLPCTSGRSVGSPLCERSITSPTSATLSCNCWPSERGLLPETSGLRCLRLGSVSVLQRFCTVCVFSGEVSVWGSPELSQGDSRLQGQPPESDLCLHGDHVVLTWHVRTANAPARNSPSRPARHHVNHNVEIEPSAGSSGSLLRQP